MPWGTNAICNNNPVFGGTGNHKTGEDYTAAPNIDHTQEFVRQDIIKWLKLLRSIGFDGFRFDFVKGYSASHPAVEHELACWLMPYYCIRSSIKRNEM